MFANSTLLQLAGRGGGSEVDGAGLSGARFNSVLALGVDAAGAIWVVEPSGALRVCMPDVGGRSCTVATVNASAGLLPAAGAQIAAVAGGLLFIADTLRHRVVVVDTSAPFVATLAGRNATAGMADGAALSALFNQPLGLAVDSAATPTALFVAD